VWRNNRIEHVPSGEMREALGAAVITIDTYLLGIRAIKVWYELAKRGSQSIGLKFLSMT
jgi:hypothetical protein